MTVISAGEGIIERESAGKLDLRSGETLPKVSPILKHSGNDFFQYSTTAVSNPVKPQSSPEPNGLKFRLCQPSDVANLDAIAKTAEFQIGRHTWELYYKTSPETFFVVVNGDDKVVGFVTENAALAKEGIIYRHQIMLLPKYRRQNLMKRFFAAQRATEDKSAIIAFNGNAISIQKIFIDRPLIFDYKQVGYEGRVCNDVFPLKFEASLEYQIVDLSSDGLRKLLAYDADLYARFGSPAKRTDFTREYVSSVESITLLAQSTEDPSRILGYGVAGAVHDQEYRISPVYADNPEVGFALLSSLANRFIEGDLFYVAFPAQNAATWRFCQAAKLSFDYAEFRCYERERPELPIAKVFAENEFWPL